MQLTLTLIHATQVLFCLRNEHLEIDGNNYYKMRYIFQNCLSCFFRYSVFYAYIQPKKTYHITIIGQAIHGKPSGNELCMLGKKM